MDRSKSRTDLLQAGRKKLQQFRQKKDSKGGISHGKSSKKSDKLQLPESDTDGPSSTFVSVASSQVTDANVENDSDSIVVSTESLESKSLSSSLPPDNIDPSVDSSSMAITNSTGDETELGSDIKLALQDGRVREIDSNLPSQDQEKGIQDVVAAEAENLSLRTSDSLDLEAGRKKLRQFCQKDSEGGSSRGKSSKKSNKPQLPVLDVDRPISTSMSTASSQVTVGNVEIDSDSNVVSTESLESQSLSNSLTPDNSGPYVDSLSVAITNSTHNETEMGSDSKLALQDQGVCGIDLYLSSQDQEKGAQHVFAAEAEDVSLRTSDSLGPEGGATYDHVSAPVDILSLPASVATAVAEPVTVEREDDMREESLLLSEDIPNTSLMQTMEDQVTDLGAMQDADGSDMKKSFQFADVEEKSHEAEPLGKSVEVFSSAQDVVSDNLSAPDEGQGDGIATDGPMRNLEGQTLSGPSYEEIILQSIQEQISEGALSGHDRGLQEGLDQQWTPAEPVAVDPTHELSVGSNEVNLTRPLDVSPLFGASSGNLLQLAEIIRGLNEEEYHFLLKSRGVVSDTDPLARSSVLPDHDFSEAFQRLKEELFLAHLMKTIFNMQLAEQLELQLQSDNQHYQMIAEVSQLQASYNEVNEKNQHHIEELANCRVELQDVSRKNVELQNQFNTAKAEVEALSARVVELQISFEMSHQDSSDLSTELADCRALISGLQTEKKGKDENLELVTVERNKLVEEQEFHLCESRKLATELADFKSSLEGVNVENSKLIERISLVTEERNKIKEEIEHFSGEIERLSLDLAQNNDLVASLQAENSMLNGNLALSADRIKNLEGENQLVVLENQRLSSQIAALQEQLSMEKGERMRLEGDLKEATMRLEQLFKENIFLNSALDGQKAKIEEIGKKHSQPLSQPEDLGNQAHVAPEQSEGLQIAITEDSLHMNLQPEEGAPGGPTANLREAVFDDSLGFLSLKSCSDEMDKVLVKLEKACNEFHSQSASFGSSGEEVSSPGVSKLIQAFESKTHEDEHEVEVRDSNEVQSPSNLFVMSTKEETGNLRQLLSKWKVHVQSAGALFKGERDSRKIDDAKYSALQDRFEELKQHCSNLEASNIELTVQCEAAKQLLGEIQEKKCHLEELLEALKQEDTHLKAKNNELYEKLGHFKSKVSELYTEICDVKQSSNDMASVIGSQLENFQEEVTWRAMVLEQGWNTTTAEIIELVRKLNESVGHTSSSVSSDARDISHRLAVSVNAATETVFNLQKKLEASCSEHEIICSSFKEVNLKCDDLLGRNELAVGVLHNIYSDLWKLVLSHSGSMYEDKIDVQSAALPDLLNYNSYQTVMKCLGDMLHEKLQLESITNEMKSELMQRGAELEELKVNYLGLDTVSKLIEDVASVLNVEHSKIEINKSPLSCLNSLVSSLVERTRGAEIQLHMSKEGYGSKETELDELKEKIHYLEALRFEKENEILVLKESLHQAEEALTAVHSELHEKTNELEHSEQRVSSIREKLGIAVSKGKGLVVQRDGLKQSLAETSSELERCLQELQLKDARLHEVETKLKAYAEASERVEALESELSYIRNSSNALRESFLLKDSMLQRIEEVLDVLDFPEQFHSRDIIEKIDWLTRSVAGNSLCMNDWEQKDSAGGGSYSDAGYVATDSWKDGSQLPPDSGDGSWKDDSQPPPDSGDGSWKDDGQLHPDSGDVQQQEQHEQPPPSLVPLDGDSLRKQFEELHSKFYGLAEQNEMLEQSLMERNSLVQRWEELVDRIDMPSHLRSMEMEDRIEWVGRALAEANHHVDSLQLKVEKYDSHCGLLNSDLEESQRTASALQTDLRALITEREHLSEKLEALIYECEKLSAQARQAELENEMLHNEIASLKDILDQKVSIEGQIFIIDGKLRKLQDLVIDVLPESETKNLVSGSANIDSLEEMLRRLIENHASLQSMKPATGVELENEMLHNEIAGLKDVLEQKIAIEETFFGIDGKLRNLQDLVSDVLPESETKNLVSGSANIDSLEELLRKLIANHASMQSMKPTNGVEIDGDHSQIDGATYVEERSIDMHDKEADIDRYKKDLEEALSELEHVKEERDRTLEKQISLSSEVEALSKRTEELQELLNHEEQKSTSVREKLNVAVRKGKSLVQQRDSLKQRIEEMSTEMEHLKSEINNRENTLAEHAQKLRQMSTYPERLEALESETMYLKNQLAETENHLQEKECHLGLILNKLGEIEVSGESHISDPVKKLEWIGKLCSDLYGTVASLEQESRKSKRASELLLAELNEVQERNDAFQEELAKVAAELVDLRKDRDSAEAARLEALSHLEKLSALHEDGKKSHFSEIMGLKFSMSQLCKGFGEVQHLLANAFSKDLESFQNLGAGLESCMRGNNAINVVDSSVAKIHDGILRRSSDNKKSSLSSDSWSAFDTIDHYTDNTIAENFNLRHQLQEILAEISSLMERIAMHSSLVQEQDKNLSKLMASIEREMTSQRESCETMRKKISAQDGELVSLRGNIDYLYKACINSVSVIENGKAELVGNKVEFSDLGIDLKTPSFDDGTSEECIKTLADRLLMVAKEVASVRTEVLVPNQNEMKATITNLQQELQEKDVQRERICSELVKQIKDAEAAANSYSQDVQSLRIQEHNFKTQAEVIEAERRILEQRVNELQDRQGNAAELKEKIRSQTDLLAAKDQEIEVLMHALDEEEVQMEELTKKIEELEKVVQQKNQEIENLESSRGKVMKKLAITVSKFDELHQLSASLLSEVEKLQSQLQERDTEISFLRQEVTRCTNDVLLASQMSNQRSSDEIFEFLMWVDRVVSQDRMHDLDPDVKSNSQVHEYKEILHRKLMSVLSKLENLRAIAESKEEMLQVERSKVEELNRKAETLEMSLHEKEMQLNLLEVVEETGKGASTNSEILEVEPLTNDWTATGTFVTPQVRSLRKGNNDHVAIAVDEDPGSTSRIEDEEDDKVHGFKSLSSSRIVPRFTRPLTDLIDGLWVSCDRTLMRRPILRLGIIIYWAIMHALLAFFVV